MASRCGAVAAILVAMLSSALSWVARPNASQSAGSTRLGFSRTRPSGDACWVHPTYPRSLPRSKGLPALRMGEAEDAIEAEVRAMRASKIKQTLEEMSIATKGVYEKEGLVQILVTEKLRSLGDQRQQPRAETETPPATPPPTTPMPTPAATVSPPRPSPPPSPSSGGSEHKRASYDGGGPEWTPPPETWTEAEFGGGDGRGARRDRVARVTGEGTVVPMIRIRPSESVLGNGISVDQKDYYCIEIGLPDAPKGPTTELFMLDTAATSSLLTPRAYERLGAQKTGISAMGSAGTDGMTGLFQVSLGEVKVAGQSFGQLKPVVMELPITDIKGKGSEGMEKGVSGILGMDFLARFDVRLDFQTGDATFAKPGAAAAGGLGSSEMTAIPGRILPTGFMVIDVKMKPTAEGKGSPSGIPAIVDLGSAFTIANWAAGKLARLEPRGPHVRYNGQVVAGAAAPGEVYKPVEVGEATMDLLIGGRKDLFGQSTGGKNLIRSRVVMFADLPGFKAMGMSGPTIILGSDVLKLGKGAMIVSFVSKKIWLAL